LEGKSHYKAISEGDQNYRGAYQNGEIGPDAG
jgi:hypothetical protein